MNLINERRYAIIVETSETDLSVFLINYSTSECTKTLEHQNWTFLKVVSLNEVLIYKKLLYIILFPYQTLRSVSFFTDLLEKMTRAVYLKIKCQWSARFVSILNSNKSIYGSFRQVFVCCESSPRPPSSAAHVSNGSMCTLQLILFVRYVPRIPTLESREMRK